MEATPKVRQPRLVGERVVLRAACDADVEGRLRLGSDPEIHRMFGGSRDRLAPMTRERAECWVNALARHPHAWVIKRQAIIGKIRLDRVDLADRRASLAVGILDPRMLGRGYGTEAVRLVLGHAFGALGLLRVSARVLAFKERAIRRYAKCGFAVEGREREAALADETWHDDLIMGVLEHEIRPLGPTIMIGSAEARLGIAPGAACGRPQAHSIIGGAKNPRNRSCIVAPHAPC